MRETSLDEFVGEGDGRASDADVEPEADADGDVEPESGPNDGRESDDGARGDAAESVASVASADSAGTAATTTDDADTGTAAGDGDPADERVLPTFEWTPTGTPCAACGDTVERRWRDGGRLVCSACKTW